MDNTKLINILLLAVACFTLSACGSSPSDKMELTIECWNDTLRRFSWLGFYIDGTSIAQFEESLRPGDTLTYKSYVDVTLDESFVFEAFAVTSLGGANEECLDWNSGGEVNLTSGVVEIVFEMDSGDLTDLNFCEH